MKIILVLIINLTIGCDSSDKPSTTEDDNMTKSIKSGSTVSGTLRNELPNKAITITVSYAAIECGCPQWFETKSKDVKFLEGVERFYLEPLSKDLVNANNLWEGERLSLTIKVTGRFSKEKELPIIYHTKGVPEKARIFWYDNITSVSPTSKH